MIILPDQRSASQIECHLFIQQAPLEALNGYGLAEGSQFEPGTDHVYSNTSTNLLAVVIEEVTGQSIAEAIDERIIEELDLTDTVYAGSDEDWVIRTPRVTSQLTVRWRQYSITSLQWAPRER